MLQEIRPFHPKVTFDLHALETTGDRDQKTLLRLLDKTNFFTKEIDDLLLSKKVRVAIHSAKDLPDPLPSGLKLIALTKGVNSGDSLVMPKGKELSTLPKRGVIGSSSIRRDRTIQTLRPDLRCIEVRGTIEKRLEQLDAGVVDGLVVAEAALLRLGLTHLNRIELPGETAPLQGKLVILAREEDQEMEELFASIDSRPKKKTLYTGLDPERFGRPVLHCPLIEIAPFNLDSPKIQVLMEDISDYTHFIFSSQNGVEIFFDALKYHGYDKKILENKQIIAVGRATAERLKHFGVSSPLIPAEATQEGIIQSLIKQSLTGAYLCLPQSALARPNLAQFLSGACIRHQLLPLYTIRQKLPKPLPDLDEVDEIVFTSPSTVQSFFEIFRKVSSRMKLKAIGPVTQKALASMRQG